MAYTQPSINSIQLGNEERRRPTYIMSSDHFWFVARGRAAEMVLKNLLKVPGEAIRGVEGGAFRVEVRGAILTKVIDYCVYHAEKLPGEEGDVSGTWDNNFITQLDFSTLLGLAKAASLLRISGLRDLAGKKVTKAFLAPGYEYLGISNIFDPATKKLLRDRAVLDTVLKAMEEERAFHDVAQMLTPHAIVALTNGDIEFQEFQPVLQILDIRQIGTPPTTQERYRFVLSDGIHLMQGILATQLNENVRNNLAVKGSVVQLLEYMCNTFQNRKFLIVLDIAILVSACEVIGDPKHVVALTGEQQATGHDSGSC